MGLKIQTSDAAQKIDNSTFLGEDVDEPSQVSLVAGVKSDCVSPSAPTRQRHDCILPEATASLCVATPPHRPPGNRSPKVATFPPGSADGSEPHTHTRLPLAFVLTPPLTSPVVAKAASSWPRRGTEGLSLASDGIAAYFLAFSKNASSASQP